MNGIVTPVYGKYSQSNGIGNVPVVAYKVCIMHGRRSHAGILCSMNPGSLKDGRESFPCKLAQKRQEISQENDRVKREYVHTEGFR